LEYFLDHFLKIASVALLDKFIIVVLHLFDDLYYTLNVCLKVETLSICVAIILDHILMK